IQRIAGDVDRVRQHYVGGNGVALAVVVYVDLRGPTIVESERARTGDGELKCAGDVADVHDAEGDRAAQVDCLINLKRKRAVRQIGKVANAIGRRAAHPLSDIEPVICAAVALPSIAGGARVLRDEKHDGRGEQGEGGEAGKPSGVNRGSTTRHN